ncbi:2-oxo acid dehydrogenase subunit E2 [candidate division KSB1 bacterium]|nr:2-oxo acid dehydrogenase subunit E2 [candidate division KSB1 bacterium]
MIVNMVMPKMGESITEGTIVKWRVKNGDRIGKDEIILEISTDKVDSEIPSPASGIVSEMLVQEGETVAVDTVIARIKTGQEEESVSLKAGSKKKLHVPETAPVERKKFLSPVVKRIAREHAISVETLQSISGSGAAGRITKKDMLNFLQENAGQVAPSPADRSSTHGRDQTIPMDHVRKQMAEHMIFSKTVSAHVTSISEADVTGLVRLQEKNKKDFEKRTGAKLTLTAFFIHAVCRAIKEYPYVNSSVVENQIILKTDLNIGIAVGTARGLIVPVIRKADLLNVEGLALRLSDLVNRARTSRLEPDDVRDGTFSITNFGTVGNLMGTPIIHQPQVAILGIGAVKKRAMVINDAIAIRSMVFLSLSYDHRIIDGLYGGSFLEKIVQLLEKYSENFDL